MESLPDLSHHPVIRALKSKAASGLQLGSSCLGRVSPHSARVGAAKPVRSELKSLPKVPVPLSSSPANLGEQERLTLG